MPPTRTRFSRSLPAGIAMPKVPRIVRPYPLLEEGDQPTLASKATDFKFDVGYMYRAIIFKTANMALSKIGKIQVLYNKKPAWDIASGADLDLINQGDGITAYDATTSPYLVFSFMRLKMLSKASMLETALNTGIDGPNGSPKGIGEFTIRITFIGLGGNEEMVPWMMRSDAVENVLGAGNVRRILSTPLTCAGAVADQPIYELPSRTAQEAFLNRLIVIPSVPDSIDALTMQLDGNLITSGDVDLRDFITSNFASSRIVLAGGVMVTLDSTDLGFGNEPWPIFAENCSYKPMITTNQATLANVYSDIVGLL